MKLLFAIAILSTGIVGTDTFCTKDKDSVQAQPPAVMDLNAKCNVDKKKQIIPGMI